ncbi:MAG: hypothetical protein J7L11_06860 [Thermoprotei archaeon]|nr:hypothetical protein [Thermoprotei archaeon]
MKPHRARIVYKGPPRLVRAAYESLLPEARKQPTSAGKVSLRLLEDDTLLIEITAWRISVLRAMVTVYMRVLRTLKDLYREVTQ